MVLYYRDLALAIKRATEEKNNLVTIYYERMANLRPTPTVAEMNAVATGSTPVLSDERISKSISCRPGVYNFNLRRRYPH